MTNRRRQGFAMDSTVREEIGIHSPNSNSSYDPPSLAEDASSSSSHAAATESLAAKAIRASSARRDSSHSSAYGQSAISPREARSNPVRSSYSSSAKDDSTRHDYTPMKNLDEPKHGFWGVLARKARDIIEDNDVAQQYETPERRRQQLARTNAKGQEGITVVENRSPASDIDSSRQLPQMHTHAEIQLKASRDVAMAMAAKAKLLLRELKTVKADLAFAKERCAQLEEENRVLRESDGGDHPEDDDLIRVQLESLLAEKSRLAQENSIYARENRILREIVEYRQLTMQDVVYIDETKEEVYYPITPMP